MTAPKPDSPKPSVVERIRKSLQDAELLITTEHDPEPTDYIAAELAPLLDAVRKLGKSVDRLHTDPKNINQYRDLREAWERVKKELP